METNRNDGAFGFMFENFQQIGLTKLEYFAAMAMQGLLNSETFNANGYTNGTPEGIASIAVDQADALIEALNKK